MSTPKMKKNVLKDYQLILLRRRLLYLRKVQKGTDRKSSAAARHKYNYLLKTLRTCFSIRLVNYKIKGTLSPVDGKAFNALLQPALSNEEFLGVEVPKPDQSSMAWFAKRARRMYRETRLSVMKTRIKEECMRRDKPFVLFWTLTLDESRAVRKLDFFQSEYFKSFKRRLRRNLEDFSYCAVLEGGDNNPHCHMVVFASELPRGWEIDPNLGQAIANKREVSAAKAWWPHGFNQPKICRMYRGDRWATEGHQWPSENGERLVARGPAGVASYMSKYLTKERGTYRIHYSRGFGQWKTKEVLAKMPTKLLRPLNQGLNLPVQSRIPSMRTIVALSRKERLKRITISRRESLVRLSTNTEKKANLWYAIFANLLRIRESSDKRLSLYSTVAALAESFRPAGSRIRESMALFTRLYREETDYASI